MALARVSFITRFPLASNVVKKVPLLSPTPLPLKMAANPPPAIEVKRTCDWVLDNVSLIIKSSLCCTPFKSNRRPNIPELSSSPRPCQATTNPPATAVTLGYVCSCGVYSLTINSLPIGEPLASKRCPTIPLPQPS